MDGPVDTVVGRRGEWMHTSLGGQFWPEDPQPDDIRISDIANGLALDCRYGGQGRVDRFYSVAEHSVHMAEYVERQLHWHPDEVMATLLHDAAEGYLNDLNRAVKHAVGESYTVLEESIGDLILIKYGCSDAYARKKDQIKAVDCSMVPLEKEAIMRHQRPWAYDDFEPLQGVKIKCMDPRSAKISFLATWERIRGKLKDVPQENWEI